ncbi:signal peptide peptidase SppA [Desulfonema magnum]|uniref:Signal peptide peptidase n=1 Tax=Desulfonema magnum TaxID=45655 RepID=A0A975BU13_9BACT|nr:signal peptide peptidase SppA [Desulfonema magnum]QTA91224.1 Signal peptide peptidase [Desulfonema magnum]
MRTYILILFTAALLFLNGCVSPQIKLFTDTSDPLQEFTLEGEEKGKVLVIPVNGFISDAPGTQFFRSKPSVVRTVVSQLRKAEKDDEIRAVLLKINSAGGTVTASDLLYHEIMAFKKRTGIKIAAVMMDIATSGAYYISLPADFIMAHPTTITGSVGILFIRPRLNSLMEKIGLDVEINKSGRNKDMGSLFRKPTEEEAEILAHMVDELKERFLNLVKVHRKVDQNALSRISTARVCLAREAQQLGLIDNIGYLSDAVLKAKSLAGLAPDAKVVVYRRTEYPDDNIYNTSVMNYNDGGNFSLIKMALPEAITNLRTGFYYLWNR